MIFKLKTSKKTMDIFLDLQAKTNLRPFALAKLSIALSLLKNDENLNFNTDNFGIELNKQTITGSNDAVFKCLIEKSSNRHLREDEYFPKYIKAHIDRGAVLLQNEYRYASDFYTHLASLEASI